MAGTELATKLQRRCQMIELAEAAEAAAAAAAAAEAENIDGQFENDIPGSRDHEASQADTPPIGQPILWASMKVWNPYSEFKDMSRKEIQRYQKEFNKYDINKDKFIDFDELKYMMEKIGLPQTHLALKGMIREVDEDKDNKISFREFLLIFHKARAEELPEDSGLYELYRHMQEIDVDKEGVKGAKNFFEAKIDELTKSSQFEEEIKNEQKEKQREAEERKQRRAAFKATAKLFQS